MPNGEDKDKNDKASEIAVPFAEFVIDAEGKKTKNLLEIIRGNLFDPILGEKPWEWMLFTTETIPHFFDRPSLATRLYFYLVIQKKLESLGGIIEVEVDTDVVQARDEAILEVCEQIEILEESILADMEKEIDGANPGWFKLDAGAGEKWIDALVANLEGSGININFAIKVIEYLIKFLREGDPDLAGHARKHLATALDKLFDSALETAEKLMELQGEKVFNQDWAENYIKKYLSLSLDLDRQAKLLRKIAALAETDYRLKTTPDFWKYLRRIADDLDGS